MTFQPGYGIDIYYIVLVIPAFLLALWAQIKVKGTYRKMSAVRNSRGLTGAQAASRVLYEHGITNVRIERTAGTLTDHFDPRDNVIRLSEGVFDSTSVAAVGIACHEAGHAGCATRSCPYATSARRSGCRWRSSV